MLPLRPLGWVMLAVGFVFATVSAQPPAPPTPPPQGTPPGTTQTVPPKTITWPKSISGKTLPEWIAEFKSPDPTARDTAVRVIPGFGPEGRKSATTGLIKLIDDPDPGVRINAMLTLGMMGYETKEDMRAVGRAIGAQMGKTVKGSMIRLHGCRTLASMGPEAFETIPAVMGIADDPAWETRQAICTTLSRIGSPLYEITPADKSTTATATASKAPVMKRAPSRPAMDKLIYFFLKDESSGVRMEATQALITIGPPYAKTPEEYIILIKPYLDAINLRLKLEKNMDVKVWLYLCQSMYDDRTMDANIKTVGNLIADAPEATTRVQALNALGVLGARAKNVVGQVTDALKQDDTEVQAAAIGTLISMGFESKFAIPDLEKFIAATKDKELKKMAEDAVKSIRAAKEEAKKDAPPDPKKK